MSDSQSRACLLLPGLPWFRDEQAQGFRVPREWQAGRASKGQQKQTQNPIRKGEGMIYKRGKSLWYKFRWSMKHEDGTKEDFMIRRPAKVRNRKDANDVEREHRRALSLGQVHPNDPWPKPTVSAPPVFRAFAPEFRQYAKTHTKPGTHKFYDDCLERLLAFAPIADSPLNAITGDLASKYARHRQEGSQKLYRHGKRRPAHVAARSESRCRVGQVHSRADDSRIAPAQGP